MSKKASKRQRRGQRGRKTSLPRRPKFRLHKASGQGFVEIEGHRHYLGRYDLPATHEKYHRFIAEWIANGYKLPVPSEDITVVELLAVFFDYAENYYGPQGNEISTFRMVLSIVKDLYGTSRAADFGPRALRTVRNEMVNRGWCRNTVNRSVLRVKQVFRWAVAQELIEPSVYEALRAISGLRQGRTKARESEPVKPVPEAHIKAIKPHVSKQVWAIIQLQRLTAARQGELVRMRAIDIDMSGDVWLYQPASHKTAHHGHERTIFLGPQAQKIVAPFLAGRPVDAYLFSPAEADAEHRAELHARRKTPLGYGNRPGTNRKRHPARKPGDHYSPNSYRRAIQRACDAAFPPPEPLRRRADEAETGYRERLTTKDKTEIEEWRRTHRWHPHQLRHNAATEIRRQFGIETARVLLGHRSPLVTEIYAAIDQERAVEAMRKFG